MAESRPEHEFLSSPGLDDPDSNLARSCLLRKGPVTWISQPFHTELAAKSVWTPPCPRGPLPRGEDQKPRETEEVAATLNHQGPLQD